MGDAERMGGECQLAGIAGVKGAACSQEVEDEGDGKGNEE
jgi:hypothetical protein